MCGICGEINFRHPDQVDPGRVRAMARSLAHRGPDGEGVWHEPGAALGHRRLAIIDLTEAASQPMAADGGRYQIVFNGEIYNHPALRKELEEQGERFATRSDTEVILRALVAWGLEETLPRLEGMWAFALWDRIERRLVLCRDRMGIKPLYFATTPGGIVFASEIHPLLLHPSVTREIHLKSLCEQVACRYVLAPHTLLKGIRKLPPGHHLVLKEDSTRISPYWRIPLGGLTCPVAEEDALADFSHHFEQSVQDRLLSDVPLGVLLSGGVDSSAVVAALRHLGQEHIATYTVAFQAEEKFDERPWSRRVADRFDTEHHELLITPEMFLKSLPEVLSRQDDPVADLAVLPLFHVCRLASESVKVLLSGQGADEMLGGYHFDRVLKQIGAIRRLRSMPGARRLAALIGSRDPKRRYLLRWDDLKSSEPGQLPGKMRYDLTAPLSSELMERIIKSPIPPPYDRTLDAFYTEVPSHRGPLDAILGTLMKGWLPDNLLSHSDRMSMAHSVEMRVPFLDSRLVKFCFELPEALKIRRGVTKYLLKRYAVGRGLPPSLAYRRKRGFPVPWDQWIRGPLANPVREILEASSWMEPYINRGAVTDIFREHEQGASHGVLLWNLVVLAHWGQRMGLSA
jgi:asparagine synthase (glutamine-hydrolysing)